MAAYCDNAEVGPAVSAPNVKSDLRMVIAAGRVMSFIESSPDAGWLHRGSRPELAGMVGNFQASSIS